MNTYDIGDLARISGQFKDIAGTLIDPTTVRFKFTTPAGVVTTYIFGTDGQLVKDSVGNYHVDLSATEAGVWFYRWESGGTGQAAEEGQFSVTASAIRVADLIVEDGTAKPDSESYISVADANIYHDARGNAAWAAVADKEAALRKATDYMVQAYRPRWKGYRKDGAQALDWPRTFVYLEPFVHGIVGTYPFLVSDIIVPEEIKKACAEYALIAASASLAPNLDRAIVREKVGPLETEFDKSSPEYTRYRAMDMILRPYLTGGGANVQLVRS
jgi:hypothetical protein